MTLIGNLAIPFACFALLAALAALLGAANFGTALGVGQIGFAAAAVYVLLKH